MFPSPAKPRELSKHVTCIPWHEYQMFPSLQLTDEESVPNPQPAMVLLLIIWNFCLAIIVICICENGTSYFHRGQAAWSSIMWPLNVGQTKSPMWIFMFDTEFCKNVWHMNDTWAIWPVWAWGKISWSSIENFGVILPQKSCHHAWLFLRVLLFTFPPFYKNSDPAS